jgi:chaperonin GroEL (HSP60 family)
MIQPQILVLKEGTENSRGKEQIISNINACQALVDVVKTTLVNSFFNSFLYKQQIKQKEISQI